LRCGLRGLSCARHITLDWIEYLIGVGSACGGRGCTPSTKNVGILFMEMLHSGTCLCTFWAEFKSVTVN